MALLPAGHRLPPAHGLLRPRRDLVAQAAGVVEAVDRAFAELGGNPGRGAYSMAVDTARAIHAARRDIAAFSA